jgi:small multidrug resistance family-3 protein
MKEPQQLCRSRGFMAGAAEPSRSPMLNTLQRLPIPLLLILATTLEVSGDAIVRLGIYQQAGLARLACFLAGAVLLFGYASFLNTAPVDFARIVGLYIATLFVVWQIISYLTFRSVPTTPILLGGALIIAGGLIITFWRPATV